MERVEGKPRRRVALVFAVGVVLATALGAASCSGSPAWTLEVAVSCRLPAGTPPESRPIVVVASTSQSPLPRDVSLEATIPGVVFGQGIDRLYSFVGPTQRHDPFFECLSPRGVTVHYAYAWWPGLNGVAIEAIRIGGVGGATLRDWYTAAAYDYVRTWVTHTIGAKSYQIMEPGGEALYSTPDTLYVIFQDCCMDLGFWTPLPTPLPSFETISDEVVRLLP